MREAIPVSFLGMNADLMCQCVEFCTDRLMDPLQQPRIYKVRTRPFPLDDVDLPSRKKANFLDNCDGEYAKAVLVSTTTLIPATPLHKKNSLFISVD
jgi:ribonucleoside-diphosphate reductase beta chain